MKLTRKIGLAIAASVLMATSAPAFAGMSEDVKTINDEWAHISYEVRGSSTQTKALKALAKRAAALVAKYPGKAEPLLWQGIVISEQANRANIFHQLGLAKKAFRILNQAYAIDPRAAKGGVAMSLGVLYYKVPGSPIGFGNKDKARQLLKQALALDPNGMDANYFYADFLYDQGDKAHAKSYALKALNAPHDPSRPAWDKGRRAEVRQLLKKIG